MKARDSAPHMGKYMMDQIDLKASDLSRILRVPASTVRHWLKKRESLLKYFIF